MAYNVISLFSGAMGLDLGMEKAGLNVRVCVEMDKIACRTIRSNTDIPLIEKDINNNARKRAIVIHGANYVSEEFIKKHGRLGRSWGCPALPTALSNEIIKSISGGRCLFIYSYDSDYLNKSKYILRK